MSICLDFKQVKNQLSHGLVLVILCLCWTIPSQASDWPALRGTEGTGHAELSAELQKSKTLKLVTNWKKPIGSGYSSVVAADDRVFVLYSDGAEDLLACLDANNGETIWSQSFGETYRGMNGSFDGPLSTPLISDNLIFTLTPRGELKTFRVSDGEVVWTMDLVKDHEAVTPLYGFATSPTISKGVLVIQHGARDSAVMGIKPATGEVLWKAANGSVNSQSPTVVSIGERELVICCCGRKVFGIDANDGSVQVEFSHEGGNGSAMVPVDIGDDSLMFTNDDSFSEVYQLQDQQGTLVATQQWKQRSVKNTYNIPCASDAGVFAFSTRILTCVDPETGVARWKSREPGDGFLITVGDWLIVSTKEGGLHLGLASEEGFEDVSHVKLFDDLVWSVPAVMGDAIYVRSLGEIARVDLVSGDTLVANAEQRDSELSNSFQAFVDKLESTTDKSAKRRLVNEFLEKQSSFPIVEEGIAHFVYQGPGTDVALACDAFGARQEQPMQRVADTDFFYLGMPLPASQRMNYMFLVDYKPTLDPKNPRVVTSTVYAGEMEFAVRLRNDDPLQMSWFGMSEFKEPTYLNSDTEELAGSLVSESLELPDRERAYPVSLYLPPGAEQGQDKRYPVIVVFDAQNAKSRGGLPKALDRLFELKLAPEAAVLFLDGGPGQDPIAFANTLADEILPTLEAKYPLSKDRTNRICWGTNFLSAGALGCVVVRPDAFGAAAVQSPLVFDEAREQAIAGLSSVDQPVKLYLEWGRFDMFNPVENWDVRQMSQEIAERVKANENVSILGGQVDDTTDWSSWRNRYDVMLNQLLK